MKESIEHALEVRLDRASSIPLYRQLAEAVRAQVRSGSLTRGMKLPASRVVASALGLHRRTVVQAFHLLESEGWVVSGVGQGTFVAGRDGFGSNGAAPGLSAPSAGAKAPEGAFSWDGILRRRPALFPEPWRYWTQARESADQIRFTGATADPSFFPTEDFRAIVDEVFRDHGPAALEYGPAEGYAPLREWVVERLHGRGLTVDPDQVLIVTGSQQGLDLVSRLLLAEGDVALVEEPGYSNGFRLFQANGARALGVPMDEGGLRLDACEELCAAAAPRLLYLMPIFQNPTGLSLIEDRVPSLLEICGRHQVPIIEDQFDSDLYYDGAPPRPVKTQDRDGRVILLGSFSKILFPGLRLGWLVVPKALITPLRELKQMADFSSGLLAQSAMNLYCRRGLLDLHLARVREIYGSRLRVMLASMEEHFPPEVRWTTPQGGLTLWVTLPEGMDSLELLRHSREAGVDFSPGPLFFPNGGGTRHLRLSYIRETEERIRRGVAVIGTLLESNRNRAERTSAAGPFF